MQRRRLLLCLILAPLASAALGQQAQPPIHRDILGTEAKLYSQGDEELIIRDFFQDRREGFFLDVGAAWPIKYNNTYYLEHNLGWYGIAIDALPEYAKAWRKRHNAKFFNFIVTDHAESLETFYRSELTGISSVKPPGGRVKYETIQVPTTTLDALLDKNHVKHVDFMSLDIEGHEPTALAGFDIDRFKPELLCVEAHVSIRTSLVEYFTAHGYERIDKYLERDGANYYFTPITKVAGH